VVWLYAGGVSLILPDLQFGMVSLDWVTLNLGPLKAVDKLSLLVYGGIEYKIYCKS